MLFWILFAAGITGFGLAAYWDLKTTEFPDWLPYGMIAAALGARSVFSLVYGDLWILLNSLLWGCVLLFLGLAMYLLRQWGDGDAWLLGAMGFLFPDWAGQELFLHPQVLPLPLALLFNFFLIGFLYMIAYSVALGLKNRKKTGMFLKELRKDARRLALIVAAFSAAVLAVSAYLLIYFPVPLEAVSVLVLSPLLLLFLLVFVRYGRFVEKNLFKRRIPASRLRPGDVLVSGKWRGLTEKEVERLRKKGGHVWIKEGVRFAPVFLITVLVTLFYGGLIWLFVG